MILKKYSKNQLINFLKKNNVSEKNILRVEKLPLSITKGEYEYHIDINVNKSNNNYEYDINYYCDDIMEFLLTHKIFDDIEISLNVIECQLLKNK